MAAKPTRDEAARLFDEHGAALYRFAARLLGPGAEAEDAVHNVLARFLERNGYDPSRGPLRAYLLGAVRRQARKIRRVETEELADIHAAPGTRLDARLAAQEAVAAALDRLPWTQREVLLLAHYEGLTLQEIAQALDLELAAVKSRLHRARESMRESLAEWKGAMR